MDNAITYEDSISWGCKDSLNLAGLKEYCTSNQWKNKMLYNVLKNISYIGQFGNANRHLLLDWVSVEPFSIDSYQSSWDEVGNKCTIPAVLNINILYATFGLVNNTQHAIMKVQYSLDYIYWWGKSLDGVTKDSFQTYININYYRVPQNTVWWYAPGPGIFRLPSNIMYPFKIGTTTYGNSSYLKVNVLQLFMLIIILIIFN